MANVKPITSYYVASSMDGFIAREDGSFDWLGDMTPCEKANYDRYLAGVNVLFMGRATFEQLAGLGWPYGDTPCHVFTTSSQVKSCALSVVVHQHETPAQIIDELSRDGRVTKIWVVGGAKLAGSLVEQGLLDEVVVCIKPILMRQGRPMFEFAKPTGEVQLELKKTEVSDENGFVQVVYKVVK
eukprot:comp9371_c0_seq1/m.4429 comp9371_c0_seq1/g.4429  ORF comp9371_c0_seq1/g.4429 comp9371_c0_seq1/m.4429 type:complete len:184 (-) comp9371_c0_seq1:604-1155(-)